MEQYSPIHHGLPLLLSIYPHCCCLSPFSVKLLSGIIQITVVEFKKQKNHCQTTQSKDTMHGNLEASMIIQHHTPVIQWHFFYRQYGTYYIIHEDIS